MRGLRISSGPCSTPLVHAGLRRAESGGYVLLFALGVLAVASTLVLGMSVAVRLNTQLFDAERRALQEDYAVRGAAQYTAMQLSITAAVDSLRLDPRSEALRDWQLWRPAASTYEMSLDAVPFSVRVEDASDLPDANLLSAVQWQRLLQISGLSEAQARRAADTLVGLRQALAKARNTSGFASLDEIMAWKDVPIGVRDLIVVGTKSTDVDLNSAPLAVLEFLGNVSPPKMQQLKELRAAGPIITPTQAQAWTAGTGLVPRKPGGTPLRTAKAYITIKTMPPRPSAVWTALITSENGGYVVVDQSRDG